MSLTLTQLRLSVANAHTVEEFSQRLTPSKSQPPTYPSHGRQPFTLSQGYLAHKNPPPPRSLQQDYTQGPMVVLKGGGAFHMSEVPLYT